MIRLTLNRAIAFIRYFCLIFFICCNGCLSVVAQEEPRDGLANKTDNCRESSSNCREYFYHQGLLSPIMVDKFGVINHETEMARLDDFVQSINGAFSLDAYIVVYAGKLNKYGEFEERSKRIKDYLLEFKKLDPNSIKIVHGGFRESFEFELWISPLKNSYPPLSPTISPEKVMFKGKIKSLSAL